MVNLKTFVKSKTFFIYSVLVHILLSVVVVLVSWNFFEPKIYNSMIRNFNAVKTGSEDVVVIVIDNKSVARYRWPWKRELYGKIFEYLSAYTNAKTLGFDSIIVTPDLLNPESDIRFYNSIRDIDNLVVGFSLSQSRYENFEDGELYNRRFYEKFKVNIKDERKKTPPSVYNSIFKLQPSYFDAVKYAGATSVTLDFDNYIRRTDQIVSLGGDKYPSLALRMYLLRNNITNLTLYDNKIIAGGLKIPVFTSKFGIQNYVHYYKLYPDSDCTHKKYSAIDLIDSLDALKKGKKPVIDPAEFNNKSVLVGMNASANGVSLEDVLSTPILPKHPGVDIQATFLDNLIHNEFVRQTEIWQEILLLVFISIGAFLIIKGRSFLKSLTMLTGFGVLYYIFAVVCFMHNFAMSVLTPLAVLLVTMVFAYSYQFIAEGRHKEKIKNAMGKYLSQDIMKNVVQNIDDIRLGGKRSYVTVLFSDIRGFTSMSENMSAEEISVVLNEYFSEMEPIITGYNGVINKFIGDAIMAIFGEPVQDINHPVNAVKCAHEMLKKVHQLQGKWLNEGKPEIEIGIGINTGEAFVGNIGSEKRLEYTVIGDTVNIASRIESYNKVYKTNFLISSSTYSYVSGIVDVIKISEVTIRGKTKKMDIYEVLRVA
ncbi:MAG: adenylate/guanylate cyclase domain-containing protein [Heliobacteriaceae bacterium]|nr:adenylate/guanylate cyclase domain-containing protein [Heliobacteriaceae bacterium]